jgi:hypothetical protein
MENDKKDSAKQKIVIFVIGTLVGAVISTTAFLISVNVLNANNSNNSNSNSSQQMGTPPEMPSGENGQQGGTPPEKPSEDQ